ncbi:MAG: hypothetical protein K9J12_17275 [Melioribacteraceae bacterium]|nr:hypothetical protein [Melioribacteraceae bacterium]MCF8263443.1 hypothetical protein [Melioribacteraceae bacterium]MCF8432084.1 hypothetical protein [Melioribacteraceae bacterium]
MENKIKSQKIISILLIFYIFLFVNVCLNAQNNNVHLIENHIRFDSKGYVPKAIYNVKSRVYKGAPENIARDFWASTLMDLEYNIATDPAQGENLGRDITTILLLKSLSYIPITADLLDFQDMIIQADVDLFDGAHIPTIVKVFENRNFPVDSLSELYDLAKESKSENNTATSTNSGRKILLDEDGNSHIVFSSGGEIFYRKNNGTWQYPVWLSNDKGGNNLPSITGSNEKFS